MLIYKSFLRKKTTKIYIIIYSLISLSLILLIFTKNILINKENESYRGSFFEIKNFDISKLNNKKNIDNIEQAVSIIDNTNLAHIYISDNELKDNEIIISSKLKEEININDEVEIEFNKKTINFIVKDYFEEIKYPYLMYISSKVYNECSNSLNKRHIITLRNWLNWQNDEDNFRKTYGEENVIPHSYKNNTNYTNFITIVNIFIIVLIILFVIVLIVTNFNIIQDENKKNVIYYKIGYNKYILKMYNLFKILFLLFISTFFAIITFYVFYVIYKLCF